MASARYGVVHAPDGRDQQVQATGPMHLVLVGAIAELTTLPDEDSAAGAVDGFHVVSPGS